MVDFHILTSARSGGGGGVVVVPLLKLPHLHRIKTKVNTTTFSLFGSASVKPRFSSACVQMHLMTDKSFVTWRRSIGAPAAGGCD